MKDCIYVLEGTLWPHMDLIPRVEVVTILLCIMCSKEKRMDKFLEYFQRFNQHGYLIVHDGILDSHFKIIFS